ncbi:acyl-CoA dehydrogenase family protein [Nocardioides sp.]|uniref:acyl-CoA dehydrogenase family protein n=1 Tax=Nocardioides sp. TaxID=35761 RepID=UPI003519581D
MEFALSSEQAELAATVRTLLERRSDPAAVRTASESEAGYDESLWRTLCDQVGVAALAVPEEHDGIGAGFFETAVVLEELGRALTPAPLLATTRAIEALLAGADDATRARLLPRLAAGEVGTVVGVGGLGAIAGDLALDADRASVVLAVRGGDLVELHDSHVDVVATMDQTLRIGRVEARSAVVVGDGVAAAHRLDLVTSAAVAALAVGLCERGLRMSVEHTSNRVQFGRPIGSFQALKHRMADMLARTEMARSASWAASYALGDPTALPDSDATEFAVRSAAAYAIEAAEHVAAETVQLHGGIAITWEHDAHLVLKRAHALGQLFGAPHVHRAALALP